MNAERPDRLEESIRDLPRRRLSPEGRRRVLDAIRAGGSSPRRAWLTAAVPLWQALLGGGAVAGASVLVTVIALGGPPGAGATPREANGARHGAAEGPRHVIPLSASLFARSGAPGRRPSISDWTTITVETTAPGEGAPDEGDRLP